MIYERSKKTICCRCCKIYIRECKCLVVDLYTIYVNPPPPPPPTPIAVNI
jgi:hypothetical protein